MSELKAIRGNEIREDIDYNTRGIDPEDKEWRNYGKELCDTLYYCKSEADKVIALLKDKANYNEYAYKYKSKELADTCRFYEEELRRHKYKRCLAMARWCESTSLWCYQAACTLPKGLHATLHGKPVMIEPTRLFKRHELLTKWSERWLEIAEKFRDNEA